MFHYFNPTDEDLCHTTTAATATLAKSEVNLKKKIKN